MSRADGPRHRLAAPLEYGRAEESERGRMIKEAGLLVSLGVGMLALMALVGVVAEVMSLRAQGIGGVFGELDMAKTQAQWERAVTQAGSIEERMEVFLDSMEDAARSGAAATTREDLVSDEEIDRMINAEVLAS